MISVKFSERITFSGTWNLGYVVGGSITALIPVVLEILLILHPGVKKEAMVPAHLAVLLTLITRLRF